MCGRLGDRRHYFEKSPPLRWAFLRLSYDRYSSTPGTIKIVESIVVRSSRLHLLFVTLAFLFCSPTFATHAQLPTQDYNSLWRNKDGSEKLALEFSGRYNVSVGSTRRYQTWGWSYLMGGGYNLNQRVGILAEYSFDHSFGR